MCEVLTLPIEWLFPGKERQETDSFYLRSEVGSRRSEIGGRRSEVGNQRSEVRGRKSEIGGQRSEVKCNDSKTIGSVIWEIGLSANFEEV